MRPCWLAAHLLPDCLPLLTLGVVLTHPRPTPAGADAPKADVKLAGYLTARTLMRTVPAAVPGIMFLSGGLFAGCAGCVASVNIRSNVL